MSTGGPGRGPPAGIPTLTEVVPWPGQAPVAPPTPTAPNLPPLPELAVPPASAVVPVAPTAPPAPATISPAAPINEAQLVQHVLVDLQRQIDLMLEVRLREALAPVLARTTDALIRDARKELTSALRDAVARAVAEELARRESR